LGFLVFILLVSPVFAADVAYVYKIKSKISDEVVNFFNDRGMSVETIKDDNIDQVDLSDYKLIFIGDECLNQKLEDVEIWKYPVVIMNRFYGNEWGFTDEEGVSQMTSNYPLNVVDNGEIIQVYSQSNFDGQVKSSIPYYFLDDDSINLNLRTIAETFSGTGQYHDDEVGSVIAVAEEGTELDNGAVTESRMCFFGIAKTDFWTNAARDLFGDCVDDVLNICDDNSDCDDDNSWTEDVCMYPGTPDSYCENREIECKSKSDCGSDGFIGDRFCSGSNVFKQYIEYDCMNEGTSDSYCDSDTENRLVQTCANQCISGVCGNIICYQNSDCDDENVFTTDVCVNPGTFNSYCDHGTIVCFDDGDCDDSNSHTADICMNPGTLDSYCDHDGIICNNDMDCDDHNIRTLDECINEGTTQSYCRNTEMNCVSDEDCGFTGFAGSEFCSQSSIFKNYQTSTCVNPATLQSNCIVELSAQLLQSCNDQNPLTIDSCTYIGDDAVCQNIVPNCSIDSDCDDGSVYTQDVCVNAGTLDSYCVHHDIDCVSDYDCGVDGWVGNPFCSLNNVLRTYREYNCVNAGTTNSYCSQSNHNQLIEECEFLCSGGSCVGECCDGDTETKLISCGVGVCYSEATQVKTCVDGTWGQWVGVCVAGTPTIEICDGLDNDCDGSIDEGGVCDVECYDDNDCGTNHWINDAFCMNGDVWQDYQVFVCRNAGTYNSYCTDQIDLILKETCEEDCIDGECYEVVCYEDEDCGVESWIEDYYCSGGNVFRNYQEFECVNAGTGYSSCVANVFDSLIGLCSYGCEGGECLACA